MAALTTPGRALVEEALPPDLRAGLGRLDKKGVESLLARLADRGPDAYREHSYRLMRAAGELAEGTGGYAFSLSHLSRPPAARFLGLLARARADEALRRPGLTDADREAAVLDAVKGLQARQQDETYAAALAAGHPAALQAASGAKGKKENLNTLLAGDLVYADQKGRDVPVPAFRSYGEGLTPAEYWAGSYGARSGVLAVKLSTAGAGAFGKYLSQAMHRLVVAAEDADGDGVPDGPPRGLPTTVDDPDNVGALLAAPAGGYPRNTPLTPKVLAALKADGVSDILVRSPVAGGSPDGRLYARDVGLREAGRLPAPGEAVGLLAAGGLSEPITQGALSAKHSGGVSGANRAEVGLPALQALIQSPAAFPGGATLADLDGRVDKVVPAPAGGHIVVVGGRRHFVPLGAAVAVKPGDRVEAGDALSDGIPPPARVVELKGIGEGRRYFAGAFRAALKAAGIPAHRRNAELLARGLIDRVELTEEYGDHAPGDVVPYQTLEAGWAPRPGAVKAAPAAAVGKHLERPALHLTVGTRLTPRMAAELDRFGVKEVDAHDAPPPFRPAFARATDLLSTDPDFMTRMYGSGLKRSFLDAAHRGLGSDPTGGSFVPGLARGVGFGTGQVGVGPADRVKVSEDLGGDAFRNNLAGFRGTLGRLAGGRPGGWQPPARPAGLGDVDITAPPGSHLTGGPGPGPAGQSNPPPPPPASQPPAAPTTLQKGVEVAAAGATAAAGGAQGYQAYRGVRQAQAARGLVGPPAPRPAFAAPPAGPGAGVWGNAKAVGGRMLGPVSAAMDVHGEAAAGLAAAERAYESGGGHTDAALAVFRDARARTQANSDALVGEGGLLPAAGAWANAANPFNVASNARTLAVAPGMAAEAGAEAATTAVREAGRRVGLERDLGRAQAGLAYFTPEFESGLARYQDAVRSGHRVPEGHRQGGQVQEFEWTDPQTGRVFTPAILRDYYAARARRDAAADGRPLYTRLFTPVSSAVPPADVLARLTAAGR